MPTDHEFTQLKSQLKEQDSRIDNLVARLVGAESVAAKHGVEHNDRGRDPIVGDEVAGHSHELEQTPFFKGSVRTSDVFTRSIHEITLPSGIAIGDTIVLLLGTATISDWNGYTELNSATHHRLAYRIADGTEGSTVTITASSGTRLAAIAFLIGNGSPDITPSIEVDGQSGSDVTAPTITLSTVKNYLYIVTWGGSDSVGVGAPPPKYQDFKVAAGGAGASRVAMAHLTLRGNSEAPGNWSNGSAGTINVSTIAVHPVSTVEFGMTVGQHVVIGNATPHHADIHDYDIHTGGVPFAEVEYDDAGSDPLIDGTVSDGAENSAARKDHVHPRHHVTARPYTYSITFGWDPQSPQVFAP